ncbi:MAG TPA: hypothetical protein VE085_00285 [Burkholderiales bacterium]|nr:hypothetical protein [Burkholderiales bacterium]
MKKKVIAAAALALSSGLAQAQSMDKQGWYGGLDLGTVLFQGSTSDRPSIVALCLVDRWERRC